MNSLWTHRWTKPVIFFLCLLPLLWLGYRWQTNQLGINRLETVSRYSGDWTLRMLVATLCITPLRRLPGQAGLIRYRRMLGLFAFSYGCLHALHYYAIDVQWNTEIMWEDLTTRRFFIAGITALALMVPLALTSSQWAIRRMGGKRWQMLHKLIYLSAIAGVVHFYWQGKAALWEPIYWGMAVGVLLLYRVGYWARGKFARAKKKAVDR